MKEHFSALLCPVFPDDADFRCVNEEDPLVFRVDWQMPNTDGRPNRRSRPIELFIDRAVIDDYEDAHHDEDREAIERALVDFATTRLSQFDPSHDMPREQPVPAEKWEATSHTIHY